MQECALTSRPLVAPFSFDPAVFLPHSRPLVVSAWKVWIGAVECYSRHSYDSDRNAAAMRTTDFVLGCLKVSLGYLAALVTAEISKLTHHSLSVVEKPVR